MFLSANKKPNYYYSNLAPNHSCMTDEQMTTALQKNMDIILVPRSWWPGAGHTLEPQEMGWWYTISNATIFQECNACHKRRGDDLDKGTKTASTTGAG